MTGQGSERGKDAYRYRMIWRDSMERFSAKSSSYPSTLVPFIVTFQTLWRSAHR